MFFDHFIIFLSHLSSEFYLDYIIMVTLSSTFKQLKTLEIGQPRPTIAPRKGFCLEVVRLQKTIHQTLEQVSYKMFQPPCQGLRRQEIQYQVIIGRIWFAVLSISFLCSFFSCCLIRYWHCSQRQDVISRHKPWKRSWSWLESTVQSSASKCFSCGNSWKTSGQMIVNVSLYVLPA